MTRQPQPTVEIWIQCTPATSTAVPTLPYVAARAHSFGIIIFYRITYYTIVVPTTTFFLFLRRPPLRPVSAHDKCIIKILSTRHYYRHCCCWIFPSERRSLVHSSSPRNTRASLLSFFIPRQATPPFFPQPPPGIAASVPTCQHRTATARGLIDDDVFKPLSAIISHTFRRTRFPVVLYFFLR